MPKATSPWSVPRPQSSIAISSANPCRPACSSLDSMFALGRGQRELIIGDRAIGKTAIAVDCIINQKTSDIICVYVAVGQKSSTVKRVINAIQAHGAPERCIFVVASASAAPGLQWIAPFAGFTMAEYFRDRGQHALVVIDDMTKHAATHREIALLTRQPPGREAYPGDVFYVHARLLERAAKLSKAAGGGSLTALPIAELDAGNLSAYIPTNLISITDGQIVLDCAAVLRGSQAGGRCRDQRQPRRRQNPGAGLARCGGNAAARLRPVSGTRNFHALRRHHRSAGQGQDRARAAYPRRPLATPIRAAAACGRSCAGPRIAGRHSRPFAAGGHWQVPLRAAGLARSVMRRRSSPGSSAPDASTMPSSALLKTSVSALVTQLAPPPAAAEPGTV